MKLLLTVFVVLVATVAADQCRSSVTPTCFAQASIVPDVLNTAPPLVLAVRVFKGKFITGAF
jgi:hypothetical protein